MSSETLSFQKVQNPADLLPILKSRHPNSCFLHNQIKKHQGFSENIAFYTIGTEVTSHTWIISNYVRHDHGPSISVSAPISIVTRTDTIDEKIKQCFSSPTNGVIDWDSGMWFIAEKAVSEMLFDISINVKGNVTEAHPSNLYYMEIADAARIDLRPPPSVELRRLDATQQEENFFVTNWKYSLPGSELDFRQSIKANPSGGIFVQGACVAGVATLGYGLLAALHTVKEERRKGYGKLAMKFAFRENARDGCYPCLTVEQRNKRSIQFTENLGATLVSGVDWIKIQKLEVD